MEKNIIASSSDSVVTSIFRTDDTFMSGIDYDDDASILSQTLGVGEYGLFVPRGFKLAPSRFWMPDSSKILSRGYVITRNVKLNISLKNGGEENYWIRYGDTSLFIFHTKEVFDEWLTNRNISRKRIDSLIKYSISFSDNMSNDSNIRGYTCTEIIGRTKKLSKEK